MTTFATLELGEAADAKAWEKGCQSLGFMSRRFDNDPTAYTYCTEGVL